MEHWTLAQLKEYQSRHKTHAGKQVSHAELNFEQLYILPRMYSGKIKSYRTQVEFELWPKTNTERRIMFTPDFVIEYMDGRRVVVELKGKQIKKFQRDYHLRWRRMQEIHPEYEYVLEKSEDWT
jgi:Protein of unknown function (DUF1064).